MKEIFPVDGFYLDTVDLSLGIVKNIATINTDPRFATETIEPIIGEELKDYFLADSNTKPEILVLNRVGEETDFVISHMVMQLSLDGQNLGMLNVQAKGADQYTKDHARLLSLVRGPFSWATTNALMRRELSNVNETLSVLKNEFRPEPEQSGGIEIIGRNFGLKSVMEMVDMVTKSDSPVLLMGETGVGKDVIANAIHYESHRKNGPFIKVNCGAIPDNLVDSELFGHEKGAFTGAIGKKEGRFEQANGGSIFLDEIGELPPHAQVRLLRVLQHKEIDRVGGTRSIPVDVRIISATNQNLEERVQTGAFREDLWFRLNVFPIIVPPLRRRIDDIPALVHHFLVGKAKELKLDSNLKLSHGTLERLKDYHWPGNVRELENIVERELILSQSREPGYPLTFQHVSLALHKEDKSVLVGEHEKILRLDEIMTIHFKQVLDHTQGRIYGPGGAAELLDIHPDTFRHKLRKLGIPFGRDYLKRHK